jgi:hypothetical protein
LAGAFAPANIPKGSKHRRLAAYVQLPQVPHDSILPKGLIKNPEKSIVRFANGLNSRFKITLKIPSLFFCTYRNDQR